ncbi:MAG: universal stress protein [Candidatus Sumerlaeia bacterium]
MLRSILVAYDPSDAARAALDHACYFASLFGGKIYVTHVVEIAGAIPIGTAMIPGTMEMLAAVPTMGAGGELEKEQQERREEAARFLEEACRAVQRRGIACEVRCESGFPLDKIKAQAESVDLLAIGKFGPGGEQPRIGRLAEPVARCVPQPVLLASPGFQAPSEIILIYNGGEKSHRALTLGAEIALQGKIPLRLITLADTPDEDARLAECATRYLSDHGAAFSHESVSSAESIDQGLRARISQTPAALVIMGAFHGTRLLQWLTGHPTLSLIRDLPNPIIVCSH